MKQQPLRIYIAGPISATTEEQTKFNVMEAMTAYLALIKKGHYPYCPHLCTYADTFALQNNITITYDEWLKLDFSWLNVCDIMIVLKASPGVKHEINYATMHNITWFDNYREIPTVGEEVEEC
jgi:hypothetical protein